MSEPREYHDLELLTEILGFIPKKFLDELYDHMNVVMYNVTEGVNERLEEMHKDKAIAIFDQFKAYEKEVEIILDNAFSKFEQYIYMQVWRIPEHLDIRLYSDSINLNINEKTQDVLKQYITELETKTRVQKILNIRLKRELQQIEYQKKSYEGYRKLARIIKEASQKKSLINFEETVSFLRNQVDELKEVLNEVLEMFEKEESKEVYQTKDTRHLLEKLARQ